MQEYIIFMYNDTSSNQSESGWETYIQRLSESGSFRGGSAIGSGQSFRKVGLAAPIAANINGFIRIIASDMDSAYALMKGNPTFEAGGTIEIRELPMSQ